MAAGERDRGLPRGAIKPSRVICSLNAKHISAFLLSGSMTSIDVQKLFLEVQSLILDFEHSRLVADEAPNFCNGFKAVFPNAATRLYYCTLHLARTNLFALRFQQDSPW
ncbi:hypothetical protein Q1695_003022 [Nippostrongylus brasiliensis]|nr:hypothetical protein Q1695_003022 [Nippostrongylus brasiliensis]